MDQPKISIITPSFNQAGFIEDTLESVANQTYSSVEHFVVDGGSEDGTVGILKGYEQQYDLQWSSEPDEGQSDAINKGFERAKGDIVAWLNSDDTYFDVDVLARVAEYFEQHDADVIYGDLVYIDQHSVVTAIDARPDFDPQKLPYRILIGQPATFFRRQVVEEEKLDIELDYSMDYEYWLRLSERFTFLHVDDILAGFRSYPDQKSQDQSAMAAELESILTEYSSELQSGPSVVLDNLSTEVRRLVRGAQLTYQLHRSPPDLAFQGDLAPLPRMLLNLGPGFDDVFKAWHRWRSGGASG